MFARVVAAVTALVVVSLAFAAPASAGENDQIATNPFIHQTGPTTVDVGVQQTGGSSATISRSGPRGVAPCEYNVYDGQRARATILQLFGLDIGEVDPAARYVFRICRTGAVDLVATYRIGDPVTQLLVDLMAAVAYDQLQIPVLRAESAPAGDEAAPFVAQLPTWLWVAPATWAAVQADAAIPGARVVATATPEVATWRPRPDATVICNGPGVPYDFTIADSAQATACAYTYTASSARQPGQTFDLRLTVRWTVSWVCEPACGTGELPPFEITSSRPVRVAEVQALNTRSR